MKEEKYIQSLFEQARHEEPQLSYEEVAHDLDVAINPGKITVLKDWFFHHIYLNTFIAILSIFILSGFMFLNSQTNETKIVTATLQANDSLTPTQDNSIITVIENKQTTSVENKDVQEEEIEAPVAEKPAIVNLETETKSKNFQIKKVPAYTEKTTQDVSSIDKKFIPAKVKYFPVKKTKIKATPIKELAKEMKNQKPSKANSQTAEKLATKKKTQPEKLATIQDNRSELEIVLETTLNSDKLKEDLFLKNRAGDFQQLIIRTNHKFDNLIDVQFAGKKSIIINTNYSGSFNIVDDKFVDIQSLNINKDKAILEFTYNSEFIQVELEKIGDQWTHKYTSKTYAQEDHFVRQELLQMMLDSKKMTEVIEKNKKGDSKPFALVTNGLISDHLQVNFEGKDLEIVQYPSSLRVTYAKIMNFQIRKKKATLEFTYQGTTNEVNFRNKNGEWTLRSFKQL